VTASDNPVLSKKFSSSIYRNDKLFYKPPPIKSSMYPDVKRNKLEDSIVLPKKELKADVKGGEMTQPDILRLEIMYQEEDVSDSLPMRVHKSRDLADVYNKVERWIQEKYNFDSDRQIFRLMFRNQIMKRNVSLKDADI